jgi:hypothetical protein
MKRILMQSGHNLGHQASGWYCSICDLKSSSGQHWFAVAQSPEEDRLSIFHREDLASPHCIRDACSSAHARELVIHWMITGSLDYPFAEPAPRHRPAQRTFPFWQWYVEQPIPTPICELAIDRDAVLRLLYENPAGLEVILNELNEALEQSIAELPEPAAPAEMEEDLIPHI